MIFTVHSVELSLNKKSKFYLVTLSDMVAIRLMWLFTFKLNYFKLKKKLVPEFPLATL